MLHELHLKQTLADWKVEQVSFQGSIHTCFALETLSGNGELYAVTDLKAKLGKGIASFKCCSRIHVHFDHLEVGEPRILRLSKQIVPRYHLAGNVVHLLPIDLDCLYREVFYKILLGLICLCVDTDVRI